jgi:chromosome segregation ATPase
MFNTLKGFIFEEDKPKVVVLPPPPPPVTSVATAYCLSSIIPPLPVSPQDAKFCQALMDKLKAKELREYDYLKYMSSTIELASVVADEKTRFITAFLSVKSLGVTKEKLAETANHYLAVVEEERGNFQNDSALQIKENVEQNETTIQTLNGDLKSKEEQIAKLQAEMAAVKTQRDELAAKAQEWRTKIESAKASFESACGKITTTIKDNVDKINRYLA